METFTLKSERHVLRLLELGAVEVYVPAYGTSIILENEMEVQKVWQMTRGLIELVGLIKVTPK